MGKGWLHQKNAVTRAFFVARAKAVQKKTFGFYTESLFAFHKL